MVAHTTAVCLFFVLFLRIVFPCHFQLPDDRMSSVEVHLDCSSTRNDHAVIRHKYTGTSSIFISFAQLICAGDSVPFTSTANGFSVQSAYFPYYNTSNIARPCIFMERLHTIVSNAVDIYRYTVYLSMLWSDGYAVYLEKFCDRHYRDDDDDSTDVSQAADDDSTNMSQDDGDSTDVSQAEDDDSTDVSQAEDDDSTDVSQPDGEDSTSASQDDDSTDVSQPDDEDSTSASQDDDSTDVSQADDDDSTDVSQAANDDSSDGSQADDDDDDEYNYNHQHSEDFPGIVDADCDRNTNPGREAASIHIITDLHMSAIAYCQDSMQVEFFTADTVNLYLNVIYNKDNPSPGECVFPSSDGDSFSIRIEVWEGERFHKVHVFHKDFIITCLYRSVVHNGTSWVASVHSTLTNPADITVHSGATSNSVVTLQAVDVLSRPLTETHIHMGRPIMLLGVSDGSLGEFGLRPVSCYVVGSTYSQRYAILRAGCGDGIIFPKNKGFTTTGLVTKSPYFTAFAMSLNSQVGFQCTFTFCDRPCDGNSCIL